MEPGIKGTFLVFSPRAPASLLSDPVLFTGLNLGFGAGLQPTFWAGIVGL